SIKIKQSPLPIILEFCRLKVQCLSIEGNPSAEVWMLENFFNSEDGLSKEEKIAFRVFINNVLYEEKSKQPFIDSYEFKLLKLDNEYLALTPEEKDVVATISTNYNLPRDKKIKVETS